MKTYHKEQKKGEKTMNEQHTQTVKLANVVIASNLYWFLCIFCLSSLMFKISVTYSFCNTQLLHIIIKAHCYFKWPRGETSIQDVWRRVKTGNQKEGEEGRKEGRQPGRRKGRKAGKQEEKGEKEGGRDTGKVKGKEREKGIKERKRE